MSKETPTSLLHVHSHYSLLVPNPNARTLAISSVPDLVQAAAKTGHTAVAITDDQLLLDLGELFASADQQSIRPIPGIELPLLLADTQTEIESLS